MRSPPFLLLALVLLSAAAAAPAGEVRVAVASNFARTLEVVAVRFEAATGHQVVLAPGSTGKHYAQIRNGAPFDLFFAADVRRPRLLEEAGIAAPGSRFTYAVGRLVLWSPQPGYVDPEGQVLAKGGYRYLAIANPRLAPYGAAARDVLEGLGLWQSVQRRLVRGENIAQAYQFVASGNAELGFVALSQLSTPDGETPGSRWIVPRRLHAPIEQQVVLLRDTEAARALLAFVRTAEGAALIRGFGYEVP
jgi:molybdate transport system substrate-binding protein